MNGACCGLTPCPGATGVSPAEDSAVISPVQYMHRTVAAEVAPPIDAWDVLAPYFGRQELSSRRIATDTVDLFNALQWVTANDQSGIEQQWVGRRMPAGVDFTGGLAWLIGRAGAITGMVRPWASLRIFDASGTVLRATLIALGEYGTGTNMNVNGTRLWLGSVAGGVPLAPYVTQEGDRMVLELGYRMTGLGEANAGWGSWAPAAGNQAALHVCSTLAEGVNPGSRCPYIELQNIRWPRAAA